MPLPRNPAIGPFQNCAAARAAGAAPVHHGDPGYSFDIDRDGDGVACEGS
ncbi:excalibur calcium-binding domain-containing protein [Mycobacterium frederiksbergense]|nr:excalibur calcium-binding domain-containing protein [Mycolicibacterium frederiksbergense]MCV7045988.1 excalibur calcium-binding domain-containing protein [Mycolicibacterium frederiksbergense]